jgi:hypothetical protein
MGDVRWRFATPTDIPAFFGEPIPYTVRAVVVEVEQQPAAMIGLAADGTGGQCFFSEELPPLETCRRRMAVLRAIQRVMRWVRESKVPVYSVSENVPLMEKLGFRQLEQGLFIWPT